MEQPKPQLLGWPAVEGAARELFNVWMDTSEMRWAEESWALLGQAGLTQYENDVGRCQAAIYLLTLATLYRDFCFLAWDEYAPLELDWGADLLDISPLRVGQLVGTGDDAVDDGDDAQALEAALGRLVSDARLPVLATLFQRYGGVTGLFIALWRSAEPDYDPSPQMSLFEARERELDDWDVVNDDITWGKLRAYEWLAGGAEVLG